jgi:hypothetical protein
MSSHKCAWGHRKWICQMGWDLVHTSEFSHSPVPSYSCLTILTTSMYEYLHIFGLVEYFSWFGQICWLSSNRIVQSMSNTGTFLCHNSRDHWPSDLTCQASSDPSFSMPRQFCLCGCPECLDMTCLCASSPSNLRIDTRSVNWSLPLWDNIDCFVCQIAVDPPWKKNFASYIANFGLFSISLQSQYLLPLCTTWHWISFFHYACCAYIYIVCLGIVLTWTKGLKGMALAAVQL